LSIANLTDFTRSLAQNNRRAVLLMCYLAFATIGLLDGIMGVAFALMRVEFNVGLGAFASLLIPGTAGFLISSFFVGRILNRASMATLLVGAGVLRGVTLLAFTSVPEWWMIGLLFFILGIGGGAIDSGMNTWFAIRYSPRLMNWLHASYGLGATVGPMILAFLLGFGYSWRIGFIFMTVVQIGVAILIWFTHSRWNVAPLPEEAIHPSATSSDRPASPTAEAPVRETLRLPAVWLGIGVFFFYTGVELTAGNWSYTIFTEARGVDAQTATFWVSLFWGFFTFGRVAFGFIQVKSLPVLIRTVMIASLVGALLLAQGSAPWMALVGTLIIAFSVAPIFPLLVSETPARLGRAHAQHAIGFQVGAASLGIAVLPSLAGAIAQSTSAATIPWFIVVVNILLIALHEILVRQHANA